MIVSPDQPNADLFAYWPRYYDGRRCYGWLFLIRRAMLEPNRECVYTNQDIQSNTGLLWSAEPKMRRND
jgi:hypothetical protein